jgi:hypothetical protein
MKECLRDGGGDGPSGDPVPVPGLVRLHQVRVVRGYCAATVVAMLVLMRYRRGAYSMAM